MTTRNYEPSEEPETEWEAFALRFVEALHSHDFKAAHEMLSLELRESHSVEELGRKTARVHSFEFNPKEDCWIGGSWGPGPLSHRSAVGHVYINVGGDNAEAITPTVLKDGEGFSIGTIDWGRP